MTTREKTVGQLIRERRADASKAAAARELDISPMTYDMWERDVWNPGIGYAGTLADWLELERSFILDLLYRTEITKRDMRPYINSALAAA